MKEKITENYAIYNGDCIEGMRQLDSESVHFSIYSPPFAGMYQYSSDERDLSNARTYQEFFDHYEFVVSEIARLTKPGRITAVHCMDVPKDGANICGFTDFPGDIIKLHEKHGFEYTPRICIWKEPLAVRNRTMAKSLAHRQICEDSTLVNVASSDYLIPFRKRGENKEPVTHPTGFTRYAGAREIPKDLMRWKDYEGDQTKNRYSHWIWRQYASAVWDDIRGNLGDRKQLGVLPYAASKEEEDEKHVHPLQLDVIERAVTLWTNPNELVLTPFLGVGSEAFMAVNLGRRAIGFELKESYFNQAVINMAHASTPEVAQMGLFDMKAEAEEQETEEVSNA